MKTARKKGKILSGLLILALLLCTGAATVHAEDPSSAGEPAEVQNTYEFDGIRYVNVGDESFSRNQTAYYKAMLGNALNSNGNAVENYGGLSVSDLWMRLGYNSLYYNNLPEADRVTTFFGLWGSLLLDKSKNPEAAALFLGHDEGECEYREKINVDFNNRNGLNKEICLFYRDALHSASSSSAMAEEVGKTAGEMYLLSRQDGYAPTIESIDVKKAPEESGLVFYRTLGTASPGYENFLHKSECNFHAAVVAFSDFSVTPIVPAGNDAYPYVYVTATNGTTTVSDSKSVSDISNMSGEKATASQSVSETTSTSITSSISGSSSYSIGSSIKIGLKAGTKTEIVGNEISAEISTDITSSVSKAVSEGWSKGESISTTNSKSSNVSVTLPPYTTILLSQKRATEELKTSFNCPVALNFKVTVYYVYGKSYGSRVDVYFQKMTEFGAGNSALEDLADRYGSYTGAGTVDRDRLDWKELSKDTVCGGEIDVLSATVPFDSTDAVFTEKVDTVKSQIDDVLPIYPIDRIQPENVNSVMTSQKWDYQIDMQEGDYDYTGQLGLKALNKMGAEFATFYAGNGHFVITDEEGNEDTSGSVVGLVTDKSSGQTKYVANGPGTAYLKYIMDEDVYRTAAMAATAPDQYIKNDDIRTAVIQINVAHRHGLKKVSAAAATCTEPGNTAYWVCSDGDHACGLYFSDRNGENEIDLAETVVKAAGHTWGDWTVTRAATETEEGEETRTCTACGETQTRSTEKIGHVHRLVKTAAVAASCEEDGNIRYWTCEGCGLYFADSKGTEEIEPEDVIVKATGHNYGDWEVTRAATETEEGEETRTCTACGKTQTRSTGKSGHVHRLVKTAAVAASCEEDGNIRYWTCEGCGLYFADSKGTEEIEPEDVIVKATGHSYGDWEPADADTHRKICQNDPDHVVTAAHNWDGGTVTRTATTTREGQITYTCTDCKMTRTETVEKLKAVNVFAKMIAKGNKAEVISWYKVKDADGYMVYFAPCNTYESYNSCRLVKTISDNNTFRFTKKGLKKGTVYKAYVAAFKNTGGEKVVIGKSLLLHSIAGDASKKYSNPKRVKTGKTAITLNAGKTKKITGKKIVLKKASLKPLPASHAKKYRYISSDPDVASVSAGGVIKGVQKGKCNIYVIAVNGVMRKIKVSVR